MKSFILADLAKQDSARDALSEILPGQSNPWLLLSADGDPVAYFNLESDGTIQADISGRHYDESTLVLSVLEKLQSLLGGTILSDD